MYISIKKLIYFNKLFIFSFLHGFLLRKVIAENNIVNTLNLPHVITAKYFKKMQICFLKKYKEEKKYHKILKFIFYFNFQKKKVPINLNSCPVRIAAIVWPPFILPPKEIIKDDIEELTFEKGIEIEIIHTIAAQANFTAKFR